MNLPARIRLALPVALLLAMFLVPVSPSFADESSPPGTASGTGTEFAVTGSSYLDVTLDTGVPVDGLVESYPEMVTLHVEPLSPAPSIDMTVSGLAENATYYGYVDAYGTPLVLSTDGDGRVSLAVDGDGPHVVFIQPRPSTLHLGETGWSDPSAGTWDPVTRTAVLTRDVTQTVSIDIGSVTLDGDGHTVCAGTLANAIYAGGRSGVTVRDVTVSGSQRGVYLYSCTDCLVSGVTASGETNAGVALERTTRGLVEDSSFSGNVTGVSLYNTSATTVRGIDARSNTYGMMANTTTGDTVTGCTMSGNGSYGALLTDFTAGTFQGNVLQDNLLWDLFLQGPNAGRLNVIADNVGSGGLPIAYYSGLVNLHDVGPVAELILADCDMSVIDGVTVRGPSNVRNNGVHVLYTTGASISRVDSLYSRDGVYLDNSNGNGVSGCTVSQAAHYGVELWRASGNSIARNGVSDCAGGVVARMYSNTNTVEANAFARDTLGIGSWANTNANLWASNTFTGCVLSTQIGDTAGLVASNTVDGGGCTLLDAVGTTFRDNEVSGSYCGIDVAHGTGNIVCRNDVHDNTFGIELYYSGSTVVYSNDFARNSHPTLLMSAPDSKMNLERPIGGNYWDTWCSPDADGDGFVDVPFDVGEQTADMLPLARPWHSPADVTAPVTSLSLDPAAPDGEDGWYVTAPVVTLSATDAGSGVELTEYSIGDGPWTAYEGPFELTEQGTVTVAYRSRDAAGNVEDARTETVLVDTEAPSVAVTPATLTVDEGQTARAAVEASDALGAVRVEASRGVVSYSSAGSWTWTCDTTDGPSDGGSVTFRAIDDRGNASSASLDLTVRNVAPAVGITSGPVDPLLIGTPVSMSATFSDPGTDDTHTAEWSWGDGTTSAGTLDESAGTIAGSHLYASAGVYPVTVRVTDKDGGTGEAVYGLYAVVYDPAAGFVTGGGWIISPPGAYAADPSLTGKATFGFVSRYLKGATVPSGQTEFQFKLAALDFHSTSYDWLVIAGSKAQYKGSGRISGTGDYGFMLTATDACPDMFRMKIWDKTTGTVIYDNGLGISDTADPTTALAAGSVIIHKD